LIYFGGRWLGGGSIERVFYVGTLYEWNGDEYVDVLTMDANIEDLLGDTILFTSLQEEERWSTGTYMKTFVEDGACHDTGIGREVYRRAFMLDPNVTLYMGAASSILVDDRSPSKPVSFPGIVLDAKRCGTRVVAQILFPGHTFTRNKVDIATFDPISAWHECPGWVLQTSVKSSGSKAPQDVVLYRG
jgi:hypothetical protein